MNKSKTKRYIAISKAIDSARGSWNDMSLSSVKTASLTDLEKNFRKILEAGDITEKEFKAIFSAPVIANLRPYKGKLQSLEDIDLGIVSRDYFSDIVSYITGIKFPSASSGTAWDNAKKMVESIGSLSPEMFDINKNIPAQIFAANNHQAILESCGNDRYHRFGIPVVLYMEYPDGKVEEEVRIVEKSVPKDTAFSMDFIRNNIDNVVDEYRKSGDYENLYSFYCNTADLVRSCLRVRSLDDIEFSSEYTKYGEENKLPVFHDKITLDDIYPEEDYFM